MLRATQENRYPREGLRLPRSHRQVIIVESQPNLGAVTFTPSLPRYPVRISLWPGSLLDSAPRLPDFRLRYRTMGP